MTERLRVRLFFIFGTLFFALFCYSSINLPAWGHYRGPYGDYISNLAVYERHATDAVNAINYDYRGFDTLGEEFILFTSVLGVMLLLRREGDDKGPSRPVQKLQDTAPLSETIQAFSLPAVFITVIFGFYIGPSRSTHSRGRLPGGRHPRDCAHPHLPRAGHQSLHPYHVPPQHGDH